MTEKKTRVFVFGSNEAGIHGGGAAAWARLHRGAVMYESYGHHGDSFAIPTKDANIETLSLSNIRTYVSGFLDYAKQHPELEFQVTPIGCGLAGYKAVQIAPLFDGAPANCFLPEGWREQDDKVTGHVHLRVYQIPYQYPLDGERVVFCVAKSNIKRNGYIGDFSCGYDNDGNVTHPLFTMYTGRPVRAEEVFAWASVEGLLITDYFPNIQVIN